MEYRTGGDGGTWASAGMTAATSLTYAADCGTAYDFRVRAHGDGMSYVADWGGYSDPVPVMTEACNEPPVFDADPYAFMVSEEAPIGHAVGSVSATDPDEGDTVTYSITTGNGDGKFAIDSTSGDVTVAASLADVAGTLYTLTAGAGDGTDTSTATVTIQVSAMCSAGVAVPDPSDNPGLVGDCLLLLMQKDTLPGTATLNWAAHTAMTDWDGVTVGGNPKRVTGLDLRSSSLTGAIPPDLAGLSGLERLVMAINRLTGAIPSRLGELTNLEELHLNGNAHHHCVRPVSICEPGFKCTLRYLMHCLA